MECIELNWPCKHSKRSEAATQPFLYWIEWNTSLSQWVSLSFITLGFQKQLYSGVLRKVCSQNMHQILRIREHSCRSVISNLLHIFGTRFPKNTLRELLLGFYPDVWFWSWVKTLRFCKRQLYQVTGSKVCILADSHFSLVMTKFYFSMIVKSNKVLKRMVWTVNMRYM